MDPAFSFPFRTESLPVLEWASQTGRHWVWTYLLALNLWAVNRDQEADSLMAALGEGPDFAPFYVARARLASEIRGVSPGPDLERAVRLDPENRILHVELIRHLQESQEWLRALDALEAARSRFPEDFNLSLLQARALIHLERGPEATEVLANTRVLPSENARESHRLYEQAHLLAALEALDAGDAEGGRDHLMAALEWPEFLGQGRPYAPEERLVRFLLGRTGGAADPGPDGAGAFQAVIDATTSLGTLPSALAPLEILDPLDLLALPALQALGRRQALEAIARHTTGDSELGRSAARLAGALAWGTEPPWAAAGRLQAEFPLLFEDLEGRLLIRALTIPATPVAGAAAGGGDPP